MISERISLKQAFKEMGSVRAIISITAVIVCCYFGLLYSVSHKLRQTIRENLMDVQFKEYNFKCISAEREVGMYGFYVEMRDCEISIIGKEDLIKKFVNPIKVGYDLRGKYWFIKYDDILDYTLNGNEYNVTKNFSLTGNYSLFDFGNDDVADKKLHYKYLRMLRDFQLKIDNINLKNKSTDTLVLGDGNITLNVKMDDWPVEYKTIDEILSSPPKSYDIEYQSSGYQKVDNEAFNSFINNAIDDNLIDIYSDIVLIFGEQTSLSAFLKRKNNEWSSIAKELLTSPKISLHVSNQSFYGEKITIDLNKENGTNETEDSSNDFILDFKSQMDLNLNKEIFLNIIQMVKQSSIAKDTNLIKKDCLKKLHYLAQNKKNTITSDIKFSVKKDDSSINFMLDHLNISDQENSKGINLTNNTEYKYDDELITTEGVLSLNDYSKLVDISHDIYSDLIQGSNADFSGSKKLIKKLLEEIADKPGNKNITLTYKLNAKDFKNGTIGNMKISEIEEMLSSINKKLSK